MSPLLPEYRIVTSCLIRPSMAEPNSHLTASWQ